MNKPILDEQFSDNGEHSHWHLINSEGEVLWSDFPEETRARGQKIESEEFSIITDHDKQLSLLRGENAQLKDDALFIAITVLPEKDSKIERAHQQIRTLAEALKDIADPTFTGKDVRAINALKGLGLEAVNGEWKQKERFEMPTDQEVIHMAVLFNDGEVDVDKLRDMVAMCQFVLDRLHENGNIKTPSSKEENDGESLLTNNK